VLSYIAGIRIKVTFWRSLKAQPSFLSNIFVILAETRLNVLMIGFKIRNIVGLYWQWKHDFIYSSLLTLLIT
jgi:hypothetical protein